jgi:hypothetical protein
MATLARQPDVGEKTDMTKDSKTRSEKTRRDRRAPSVSHQGISIDQSEWMTPEQETELERQMFNLGITKYGFDETTAREWAHAFCSGDEDFGENAILSRSLESR